MGYDPYKDVNSIYNLKGAWNTANQSGDEDAMKKASQGATQYYSRLRANGYADVADALSATDYTGAKYYNDHYAKKGRSATRPYLYSLGESMGLTNSQVDKLISYDDNTGEISFGGKKIGAPDTVVDGVSYWKDTSALDSAFNDYVSRSGLSRSASKAVQQENDSLFKKYNEEYNYLVNTNPLETDVGKSIIAKYDLAGLQGRDNAVASGAGSNGGNIDSYAAANAMRQQASLVNQGQQAAISAHNQRIENARALLSDMGVNIDRVYNQDETTKNNQVSRDVATSEVTGVVPITMLHTMPAWSEFFDENGNLREDKKNIDFKAEINKAVENGDENLAAVLRAARGAKIFGDYAQYGQYASDGDYTLLPNLETSNSKLTNKQIDSAERISKDTNQTNLAAQESVNAANVQMNSNDNATQKYVADKSAESAKYTADGDNYAAYNVLLSMWPESEPEKREFVEEFIRPIYEGKETATPESLKQLIINNSEKYNIDVDDAEKILRAFGAPTEWLNQYRNRTNDDGDTSEGREGMFGGMVKK